MNRPTPLLSHAQPSRPEAVKRPLYTPEERVKRDATGWTLVQGVLAPVQFLIFAVSCFFVIRYLSSGAGETIAIYSVVVKTLVLYAIMITGSIWEKVVFDKYLFAPAFFWEDVVSMLVLALHTLYLVAWVTRSMESQSLMYLALVAYITYVINAGQYIVKLRAARLERGATASVANRKGAIA